MDASTPRSRPHRDSIPSTQIRNNVVIDVVLFSHIRQLTPARQNISVDTEGGLVKEQTLDLREAGCEDHCASLRQVKHQTTVRSNSVHKSSSLKTSFKVGIGTSSILEYKRNSPRQPSDPFDELTPIQTAMVRNVFLSIYSFTTATVELTRRIGTHPTRNGEERVTLQ